MTHKYIYWQQHTPPDLGLCTRVCHSYFPLQLFPCAEWTVECSVQKRITETYMVTGWKGRAVASESHEKHLLECLLLLFSSLFSLNTGTNSWGTTPNSKMCFLSPNYIKGIRGIWLSIFSYWNRSVSKLLGRAKKYKNYSDNN